MAGERVLGGSGGRDFGEDVLLTRLRESRPHVTHAGFNRSPEPLVGPHSPLWGRALSPGSPGRTWHRLRGTGIPMPSEQPASPTSAVTLCVVPCLLLELRVSGLCFHLEI